MRTRLLRMLVVPAICLGLPAASAWCQDKGKSQDEKALLTNAESFINAFHKGDAKALAAHWTPDGDYTDQKGKNLKGRAAIEKAFQGLFKENKGLKLRIDINGLRFVTPDVAIEDGVTSVVPADGAPPSRARYTIVHVKRDGEWALSSVRDSAYAPPSHYEHLASLEWLIGSWADENEKGQVARVTYGWSENQNFILSDFTTTIKQFAVGGGTQRIGYDAATKQIRSWTFENAGGFGDGVWAQDGNKSTIKATATLADGKKLTATNIITRVDADTLTFQSHNRTVDGMAIPDVKAITMKRVK